MGKESKVISLASSILLDAIILLGAVGVVILIFQWSHFLQSPEVKEVRLDLSVWKIPLYGLFSIFRIFIAFSLSLFIATIYGYTAAHSKRLEKVLIPLLDVLQSVPVLSFMPAVTVAMVNIFRGSTIALEFSSILLIVTGQVWNLIFAFYSSVKQLPETLKETSGAFNLNPVLRFFKIELPYAVPSLVWNGMLSVAGGWFFLMACEMLVIGDRSYIMPGIGSFIFLASEEGMMVKVFAAIGFITLTIIALDVLVWRPLIAWSEKFKIEETGESEEQTSFMLDIFQHSRLFALLRNWHDYLTERFFEIAGSVGRVPGTLRGITKLLEYTLLIVVSLTFLIIITFTVKTLTSLGGDVLKILPEASVASFLRVMTSVAIALLIALPLGVYIGLNPLISRKLQGIIQILASIPATAFFPVIIAFSLHAGLPHEVSALFLLTISAFWYLLFNIIAGARTISGDLLELSRLYRIEGRIRWKTIIIPGIFKDLVVGLITASGGAWNATIVAEYFVFQGQVLKLTGLGSLITEFAVKGNSGGILASTLCMAGIVVAINRLLWRRMYALAEKKFKIV